MRNPERLTFCFGRDPSSYRRLEVVANEQFPRLLDDAFFAENLVLPLSEKQAPLHLEYPSLAETTHKTTAESATKSSNQMNFGVLMSIA